MRVISQPVFAIRIAVSLLSGCLGWLRVAAESIQTGNPPRLTLAEHCTAQVDDRLALVPSGLNADQITCLFVNQTGAIDHPGNGNGNGVVANPNPTSYRWNPDCWARQGPRPLDFSGAAGLFGGTAGRPFNGWCNCFGFTLVSDHCAIGCRHATNEDNIAGRVVRYFRGDGTYWDGVIDNFYSHPQADLRIVHFHEAAPSWVARYNVMPADWRRYLGPGLGRGMPVVCGKFWKQASVKNFVPMAGYSVGYTIAISKIRSPASVEMQSGDSGAPVFLVVNDNLVLISVHTHINDGPEISAYLPDLDDYLAKSGERLTEADLSMFR